MSDDISVIDGVFGKRYGEVLLVTVGASGPQANVYNTFPLNDCPAELWDALNAKAIAEKNGTVAALLNGPRYWLMSSIGKLHREALEHNNFGGLEMIRQATVQLASMNPAPYNVNQVDRKVVFTFDAGREIYELVDPDGRRWVMQTFSQTIDPALTLADLPGLASPACVTQDDLANSYSLQLVP